MTKPLKEIADDAHKANAPYTQIMHKPPVSEVVYNYSGSGFGNISPGGYCTITIGIKHDDVLKVLDARNRIESMIIELQTQFKS